jgi:hypothetical protein
MAECVVAAPGDLEILLFAHRCSFDLTGERKKRDGLKAGAYNHESSKARNFDADLI